MRVIVPTRTDSLIVSCLQAMENSEPGSTVNVIVGDNGLSVRLADMFPVQVISVPRAPFIHMQALNRMLAEGPEGDCVVMGDDVKITSPLWLSKTAGLLKGWPSDFGMLNYIHEGTHPADSIFESSTSLPLAGSVIPAHVFRVIGRFDERFVGYGYDDVDYCIRMAHAGLKVGYFGGVTIEHKFGTTYIATRHSIDPEGDINRMLLTLKWDIPMRGPGHFDLTEHFTRQLCRCCEGNGLHS